MKSQIYVFVDDSGDPGIVGSPSDYLVMAAVTFEDVDMIERVDKRISDYREKLGWQRRAEFKFRKTKKGVVRDLLCDLSTYDFRIFAVYVEKTVLGTQMGGKELYRWMIKELLVEIGLEVDAKVRIDGKAGRSYERKMIAYLRGSVNAKKRIKMGIKFEDSAENNLIQLADLAAGAVHRSLQRDKKDSQDYLNILQGKIVSLEQLG